MTGGGNPRNTRMEETSRRQKSGASSKGGQGPERAVAPKIGWNGILHLSF
jgi:hypothetical protein